MPKPDLRVVVSNPVEEPALPLQPQQAEMPFAMVHGEPVTQIPKDLYIPPQALEVFLEAFEGPLDLLLYLIRRQNLNILDIPLADITKQYMDYIELMQDLQLELAGEYMVMAATLAEIKSRMLLPRSAEAAPGEENDPRADLVRRLQEYERYKRAAETIDRLPRLERDVWTASAEAEVRRPSKVLPQVTLQEMIVAFREVVSRAEMFAHHHVRRERLSVRARMSDILSTLERASFVEFIGLFRPEEGRMGVTVTFMAILELVREGLLDLVQAEPYGPLHVRSAGPNRALHLVASNDTVVRSAADDAQDGAEAGPGALADASEFDAAVADAAVADGDIIDDDLTDDASSDEDGADYDDFDETDVDEQQQEAQPQASTSEPAEEP